VLPKQSERDGWRRRTAAALLSLATSLATSLAPALTLVWCCAAAAQQPPTSVPAPGASNQPAAGATNTPGASTPQRSSKASVAAAELARRYPSESITSVEAADAALEQVTRERSLVEARHRQEQQDCAPKFLTTACVDAANERRRASLATLRPIEVEAKAYKRRAKVVERDKALEEKRLKGEQKAQQEPRPVTLRQPGAAPGPRPPHAEHPAAIPHNGRATPHVAKPLTPRIAPAEQAQNIAAFERKGREAAERQREVAKKKAEKDQERARKKAEADAKSAASAAIKP
jgi:colicin import membrane protein